MTKLIRQTVPVLGSAGFSLRPIALSDVPAWYGYLSMPHVVEHTSWNLASMDSLFPLVQWYNSDAPEAAIRFAVQETSGNRLIGTVGFHTVSVAHRTAELAYDIHPAYWGRGLASACCRATTAWGFAEQHYVRIQAMALDSNAASIRVLERCQFTLVGKLRSYRMVRGKPRDFWLYASIAPT